MSAVVVTGGAGYIGSHAVKALLEAGRDVVVYDDLSAGHREAVDALAARHPGRVRLVVGDVRDTGLLEGTLRDARAASVMHFAAWLAVGESVRDPVGYYRTNVAGALSVLDAMVRTGVSRFVFSSTCAVFGTPDEMPIHEDAPLRPINSYGETKLAVERALPHFGRAYGLAWVALRYFNAAGADPDGLLGEDHAPEIHLIPRAIDAATGGAPLEVFGADYPTPDGTCQRDYVHVTDLAAAHLGALDALEDGRPSGVFNLGNGRPHSVLEVIREVERVTGRAVPRSVAPRREGDPAVLFASNRRIRDALGWQPRFAELPAIIDTAWRWHASHPRGFAHAGA